MRHRQVLPPVLAALLLGGIAAAWIGLNATPGATSRAKPEQRTEARTGGGASGTGVGIVLEPRLVGHERLSAPSPGGGRVADSSRQDPLALPPADPWLPAGSACQASSKEPEPKRYGPFPAARMSAEGELVLEKAEWTDATSTEGYELAAYDLGALAPTAEVLKPALSGLEEEAQTSPTTPGPWWAALAEELVEAVGRDRWPDPKTLLAWDPKRAQLYVRQDADGHARVAEVLTARAAGRLGSIRLDVIVGGDEPRAATALALDVPWGSAARAHRGTAWAYLMDYDIEIGMGGSFLVGPHVGTVDTGLGVSARRVESTDGVGVLDVEIAAASARPAFSPFTTTLASIHATVTIEIARLEAATWRGQVPAAPGQHRVQLDDGRSVTLVVREEQPGPKPKQLFVRHVLPPQAEDETATASRGPTRAVVTWLEPGALRGATQQVPLVVRGAFRGGLVHEGSYTVDLHGEVMAPYTRECPWPLPEGGARVRISVLPAGDMDVLDLVVERSAPAIEERPSAPCLRQDRTGREFRSWTEPLELPICPVRVDTRRIYVPVGREAVVRLDEDSGEVLRIALPRGN